MASVLRLDQLQTPNGTPVMSFDTAGNNDKSEIERIKIVN